MKLTLAIATAFSGFAYLIVKSVAPDFPITEEQFLEVFLWLLGVLGVVLAEVPVRAALIARGYTGFK
jgi:hypothetical protein